MSGIEEQRRITHDLDESDTVPVTKRDIIAIDGLVSLEVDDDETAQDRDMELEAAARMAEINVEYDEPATIRDITDKDLQIINNALRNRPTIH